jgi:hypothetical protein
MKLAVDMLAINGELNGALILLVLGVVHAIATRVKKSLINPLKLV